MLSEIKLEYLSSYEKEFKEGVRHGSSTMLVRLIKTKFGEVTITYSARISTASNEQLLEWSAKTLFASNIDEVFQK